MRELKKWAKSVGLLVLVLAAMSAISISIIEYPVILLLLLCCAIIAVLILIVKIIKEDFFD